MKKFLSVLVALVLVMSACVAFAAPVPSKTSSDLTAVVGIVAEDGTVINPSTFSTSVTTDSAATIEEYEDMVAYYEANGEIIGYFSEDVIDQIAENTGISKEELKDWALNDVISIAITGNYADSMGNVTATFKVPTPYTVGQKVAAVATTFDGTRTEVTPGVYKFNSESTALPAEVSAVDETGSFIDVTFDADTISTISDGVATTLAVLSEPAK